MKILAGLLPELYKLKDDPSVEFTLKPLTAAERLDILGFANDAKKFGTAMQTTCELSIQGWSGLNGGDNKPVPFNVAEIQRLPMDILIEVAQHILGLSILGSEEKKI